MKALMNFCIISIGNERQHSLLEFFMCTVVFLILWPLWFQHSYKRKRTFIKYLFKQFLVCMRFVLEIDANECLLCINNLLDLLENARRCDHMFWLAFMFPSHFFSILSFFLVSKYSLKIIAIIFFEKMAFIWS